MQFVHGETRMGLGASVVAKMTRIRTPLIRHLANPGCNFVLFLQSHSDYETGHLSHAVDKNIGEPCISPIDAVSALSIDNTSTSANVQEDLNKIYGKRND
jgi:hypothetical protein